MNIIKRVVFLFCWMLFSLIHAEYMDKNEIHHKNDNLLNHFYGKNKKKILQEYRQLCYSKKKMREYYCYNAGFLEYEQKHYKKSKAYLKRAILINPYLTEALSLYNNLYPKDYPVYHKKKGIYYYQKAIVIAKKRYKNLSFQLSKVLKFLRLSKKYGFLKKEMLNDLYFRKFRRYKSFQHFRRRLKTSKYRVNSLVRVSQKSNRLYKAFDTTYTYTVYKRYKNPKKTMYLYFKALDLIKEKQVDASSEYLKKFMNKVIQISKQNKKDYENLPVFALIFIKSQINFKNSIKTSDSFKWIKRIAENYNIDID